MTLSSLTSRVTYPGAGSAGPFAFPYRVLNAEDLLVTRRSATNIETLLVLNSDYTVSGVLDASGSITLTSALVSGEILTIRRAPPLTQSTSIRNAGSSFHASTVEDMFDRATMQLQSVMDNIDRTIRWPETADPGVYDATMPIPQVGKVLTATATGFQWTTLDSSATVALPAGGRTVASLTNYIANQDVVNALDFMSSAQVADVRARARVLDVSTPLQNFLNYVVQNQTRGRMPAGDYRCVTPPTVGTGSGSTYRGMTIFGDGMAQNGGGTVIYCPSANPAAGVLTVKKDAWRGLRLHDFSLECPQDASLYGLLYQSSEISQPMAENIYLDGPTRAIGLLQGTGANGEFPIFINMRTSDKTSTFFYMTAGQAYIPVFIGGFAYLKQGGVVFDFDFTATIQGGGIATFGFSATPLKGTAGAVTNSRLLRIAGSSESTYTITGGRFEHITRLIDLNSNAAAGYIGSNISIKGAQITTDNRKGHVSNTLNSSIKMTTVGNNAPDMILIENCKIEPDDSGGAAYNDVVVNVAPDQTARGRVVFKECRITGMLQPPYVDGATNTDCVVEIENCIGGWASHSGVLATAFDVQSRSMAIARRVGGGKFNPDTIGRRFAHSRAAQLADGKCINHIQKPQFREAESQAANTAADAPWVHGGTTATFLYIRDLTSTGSNGPATPSPWSRRVGLQPTSYVYQDMASVNLNASNITNGGTNGKFVCYQALLNSIGGTASVRFTLENSSTGKIYDQVTFTGSGQSVDPELVTLCFIADLTATGNLRLKIENLNGANYIELDFAWQFVTDDPYSAFVGTSGAAVTGTHRWGAVGESLRLFSRLALPYKSDYYGGRAPLALTDLQSDLYLSSSDELLTYFANAGWQRVPQSRVQMTAAGNVGAGETDLMTVSVPAKTLFATGHTVVIEAYGTTVNNANAKTLKFYLGAGNVIITENLTISQAAKWHLRVEITRVSGNNQKWVAHFTQNGATLIHDILVGTGIQTDTSAITLKLTGTATANNDITQEYMRAEFAA